MKLKVWRIPQVPMRPFYVNVDSVAEGVKILNVLADYDIFQYENDVKPDYANSGGIQIFDPKDDTDSPEGSWVDWYDEESGIDDPEEWLEEQNEN